MNSISILTKKDLKIAYNIEIASHAFPWTKAIFFSNQDKGYFNLKLSSNGKLLGFTITQIILDEATLFNIAIHPKYKRCGFGRYLLQGLIERLILRGVMTLWLEVRVSNVAAISLYNDLGFNEVTLRHNYYPSSQIREDAIVMALILE